MSLQRLRTDFRFAILSLFGVIAVAAILPFSVYRFAQGQMLAGWVDLSIVLSICLAVVHAWRGGSQNVAALFVVVTTTAGCLWVAFLLGLAGLLWMYPVLVSHYLLLDRRHAAVVSVVAVGVLLLHGGPFDSGLQQAMFLVSSAVTSVFAFIFAQRTDRQREQLEQLAHHDPLTGAGNRRALERELRIAVAARQRGKAAPGLLLLDLDHFKRINDSHGHGAGDQVLRDIGTLLRLNVRKSDLPARLGGDEFGVILYHTHVEQAKQFVEMLLKSLKEYVFEYDGFRLDVGFSVGIAQYEVTMKAPRELYHAADRALYQSKRAGRGGYSVYDPTPQIEEKTA